MKHILSIKTLLPITGILIMLAGCSDYNNTGFPRLFSPLDSLDPANQTGTGSGNLTIYVVDDTTKYRIGHFAVIDVDNGAWTKKTTEKPKGGTITDLTFGDVYLENIPAGRHLIKINQKSYQRKDILINAQGTTGMDQEITFSLTPKTDGTDKYEDNDTWQNAYYLNDELASGLATNAGWNSYLYDDYIYGTILEPGESDWYEVATGHDYSNGGYFLVTLSQIPVGCDLDLKLYKNNGGVSITEIATSSNMGNTDESIENRPPAAGSYFIQIYSPNPASFSENEYSLYIKAITP